HGQWYDKDVKSSLDLCLSCKGCKSDCPVGVDVATYKAEFLAHYYAGRNRPLLQYAFGYVDRLARLGSRVPRLANSLAHGPIARKLMALAGFSSERQVPALAEKSFQRTYRMAPNTASGTGSGRVVLWPDTFNNYFHPETAQAAVEVLEAAGFSVTVPRGRVCCGRPLYDVGMLDRAKKLLRRTLKTLSAEIDAGVPVIVLEPSCASVFRDELLHLFPDDEGARKFSSQVFLLSEFLQRMAPDLALPQIRGRALVHGHCHHKSVLKMTDEEAVLRRLGLDFTAPAQGCCGMAGAFGFEHDKYDVSVAIGELELFPAVRETAPETMIIADGFSCREQIQQCTGRKTMHLAEVIQQGLQKSKV